MAAPIGKLELHRMRGSGTKFTVSLPLLTRADEMID
jgi:hypothetical protein